MRNEADKLLDSLDETFETAKLAGCPVVIHITNVKEKTIGEKVKFH